MAKSGGTPVVIDASTVRAQVASDLGLTLAELGTGGAGAPANAELGRAMVAKIASDRSEISKTETARMLGYRAKKSIDALIAKLDAGDFDAHAAVIAAGHSTATQLKNQLETSAENA